MEREAIFTGIGGQGVQLAAKSLARAAAASGLHVMLFGMFGGSVRGGKTEATLVVSDEPVTSPPIVPQAWSAVALHPKFFDTVAPRVRDGGVVVFNTSLMQHEGTGTGIGIPLNALAEELGNPALVGMIALGGFVAASGLVTLDAAVEGMRAEIPPWRAQRIPENEAAIARGFAAAGVRA